MTPDELRDKIEGFTDRDLLIEIYTRVENMGEHIDHLDKQIHGNGQAGLKDRVAKLEEIAAGNRKLILGALAVTVASIPGGDLIMKKLFGI